MAIIVKGFENKTESENKEYEKEYLSITDDINNNLQIKIPGEKTKHNSTIFPLFNITGIINLENRRYIGNKAKLVKWIFHIIEKEIPEASSFFDVFAGTASVAKAATKRYKKVIINDMLYSNNIIYKAFFKPEKWDGDLIRKLIHYFNNLNPVELKDNYFSVNFGNKFFDNNVAKQIGFIRQRIEDLKPEINEKEYCILLASLIYSMDKIANTVGHYDAYIKKPINNKNFVLKLIKTNDFPGIEIYRNDANELAKKIKADIAYIDPPYNSRQYSRFYHVYETIVKWDKPKLYGIALKPNPENMSKYCTIEAKNVFKDLVENLNVRYLVVSYNNTYESKSKSSENKIKLNDIVKILNNIGDTKIFEQKYKYFNTGKTAFNNHKEFIFITKKDEQKKNL